MDYPVPGWEPQQDIFFTFRDQLGTQRSSEEMQLFIDKVRNAANECGFEPYSIVVKSAFAKFFDQLLDKDVI